MARAAEFFNTHPYLAGLGVGALARAEHDGVEGELIRRLRMTLVSPLGSVGDRLVWAGILPVAAGLGLSVAAFTSPLAGALSFLALFNVAHLSIRTWALKAGWRCGKTVAAALSARGLQSALRLVGPAAAFVVGAALPLTWEWLAVEFAPRTQASIVVVGGVALIMARWIVPSLGSLKFGLLAAAVALGAAWLR
jgi:mannose/fructose/N-acetylgalactosamine-specific phosphotransferase system component IID